MASTKPTGERRRRSATSGRSWPPWAARCRRRQRRDAGGGGATGGDGGADRRRSGVGSDAGTVSGSPPPGAAAAGASGSDVGGIGAGGGVPGAGAARGGFAHRRGTVSIAGRGLGHRSPAPTPARLGRSRCSPSPECLAARSLGWIFPENALPDQGRHARRGDARERADAGEQPGPHQALDQRALRHRRGIQSDLPRPTPHRSRPRQIVSTISVLARSNSSLADRQAVEDPAGQHLLDRPVERQRGELRRDLARGTRPPPERARRSPRSARRRRGSWPGGCGRRCWPRASPRR